MLAKKLLVRTGSRVAVIIAPGAPAPDTVDLVLPPGAIPSERGAADIVLVYAGKRAAVAGAVGKAQKRLAEGGILWVAYPKANQLGTDLNRDVLARALHAQGLEPVGQIAVDDVWSALRVKRDAALSAARQARGVFADKPAKKKAAAKKKVAPPKKTAKAAKTPAKKKSSARR